MRIDGCELNPEQRGRVVSRAKWLVSAVLTIVYCCADWAGPDDAWPLFRGNPQSTGVAATTVAEDPDVLWQFAVPNGSFESTAAIVDGVVYLGDFNGKLFAFDLNSGEKKWEVEAGIGFAASPAVHEGKVYIGDLDGKFFCFDVEGKKLWEFEADGEIDSAANFYKGWVLFGSQDSNLYCLKADSGELVWQFAIDDQIRCTPTIVENRAFVAGCDGRLHVIDVDQGKEVGAVEIAQTGVTPSALGDRVFCGTQQGIFFAVDWKTLRTSWQLDTGSPIQSSPAIGTTKSNRQLAIFGNQARKVLGLDCESGEKVWEFTAHSQIDSSPVVVDRRAFVAGMDGRLYQLNVDDGSKIWEKQFAGGFIASPAIAQHRIVIASRRGVVYCLGR